MQMIVAAKGFATGSHYYSHTLDIKSNIRTFECLMLVMSKIPPIMDTLLILIRTLDQVPTS